ncbi:beta-glucuronidase [Neobacillus dielmonensis]|uniref:beta-glucuronidase n=1 Tax=Neobacillus dielmonensis TaxID=1347369 RepID=UPI0005AB0444|nr:beta-glucuronidase [Neobacillus dielmonensis]
MLYPQTNHHRSEISLDGFWRFAKDEKNEGQEKGWQVQGIPSERDIAVPASWNEQNQDLVHYFGTGWYEKAVVIPGVFKGQRIFLRIGAANYYSYVWFNGKLVGEHEGGHLPFQFDVTNFIDWNGPNRVTIAVDVRIKPDSLPAGEVEHEQIIQKNGFKGQFPRNYYDFFPYGGINRPVRLVVVPQTHIEDITVVTDIVGTDGIVDFTVTLNQPFTGLLSVRIDQAAAQFDMVDEVSVSGRLTVPDACFWSVDQPHLYQLLVELLQDTVQVEEYRLKIGIRTIRLEDGNLLLNGEPVFLRGVGLHEDFAVLGKGMHPAVIVKDMNLLQWLGGNSLRTSHYPYSEEFLNYADENGILVIGETPFVGFVESHYNSPIQEKAKRVITEMIHRDKNHPSIIAWSLANEGNTFVPAADGFYKALYDHAKALDQFRPITIVNCLEVEGDVALKHFDFVCLNRYYGWYTQPGLLDEACEILNAQLDRCFELFGKPVMVTEFGADAVAGMHMDPPELFSEEYQAELIMRYYKIIRSKSYTMGAHIWVLSDFKTSQNAKRVILNRKGLFTRDRQPKLAAHTVQKMWEEENL